MNTADILDFLTCEQPLEVFFPLYTVALNVPCFLQVITEILHKAKYKS